jgi:hypothetical protein
MPIKKTTILAAFDDLQNLRHFTRNLHFDGYEVIAVSDGQAGARRSGPTITLGACASRWITLAEAALRPVVQPLATLAGAAPISLHLLVVVAPLPLTGTAALGRGAAGEGRGALTAADTMMKREAEDYLCATAEQIQRDTQDVLRGQAVAVTWAAVWGPDVAHTILTAAEVGLEDGESALHAIH